jgi:hypothetical protein
MANASALGGGPGGANAASNSETANGVLAQAQSSASTFDGSTGAAQSTAITSYSFVRVQSAAVAQVGGTATTNAIAQGGDGQPFANPGQTAYAFSTALPDKTYATTLIDGASNVADTLLRPIDTVRDRNSRDEFQFWQQERRLDVRFLLSGRSTPRLGRGFRGI